MMEAPWFQLSGTGWSQVGGCWLELDRGGKRKLSQSPRLPSCSRSLPVPLWAQPSSFSSEVFCLSCDLLSWHINQIVGAQLSLQETLGESQLGPFCSDLQSPSET